MSQKFKYDVFLSHSSKDKEIVRNLAEKLKADGVKVWFDEWSIELGDSIPSKIEEGLEQSRILILAMSANAFGSDWVSLERNLAIFHDLQNKEQHFVPVRLDNSEIKSSLKQFAYLDLHKQTEENYQRLFSKIRKYSKHPPLRSKRNKKISNETLILLKGHSSLVRNVAISSDNNFIVSCSGDQTLRIWDRVSGKCLKVLYGHSSLVRNVAISSDDNFIVSCSYDNTLRIWDSISGKCLHTLKGHSSAVFRVILSSNDEFIVSCSGDQTLRIWDSISGKCLHTLKGHSALINSVAISSDDNFIVSCSEDNTLRIWDSHSGECLHTLKGHSSLVRNVAISSDDEFIVSCSDDNTLRIWDSISGKCLKVLNGHSSLVRNVAISSDDNFIVSCSDDNTLRIWDSHSGFCLKIFEGHSALINSVAISSDDNFIVSCSEDNTLRIWDSHSGECLKIFAAHSSAVYSAGISSDNKFIVSCSYDNTLCIWDSYFVISKTQNSSYKTYQKPNKIYKSYTNAKVLLIGDSGVGKSGLAQRLINDDFVETSSTDGVWATQMKMAHNVSTDEEEREIWLWDFAGQSDYRLIHQLFMDETSLAVLVFNPQTENPFEGLGQWDSDIQKAAHRPFKKLLVAGRCDRGGLTVSQKGIEEFKNEKKFANYLETSAKTGEGCKDLRQAIIENINWEEIPYRTSPRIFKILKEEIIKLKDEGKVLLRLSELKQNLEMRLTDESFTLEEVKTVSGLLAGSGLVWELGFGDFILLQPERINSYAAAVVRKVRKHIDEIGCISKEDVLQGNLDYQDMKRLEEFDEQIILLAMYQTFVENGLCIQEKTDEGVLLVFPSYFRRERPVLKEHPAELVTYKFKGMLDEIYSTLVVRLHHTKPFDKDQLWRYAADFKTQEGKQVGLKMTKTGEGSAKITVYFDNDIPDDTKVIFIRYVQDHLMLKGEEVERIRHYFCPHCQEPFENQRAIKIRLDKNLKDIICPICEEKFLILDLIEKKFASDEFQKRVREMEENAKISIDSESRELILVGHAYAIAGKAGQIFRQTSNSDWGIDGEIEFKNSKGKASGKKVYLQLKSGDSYLRFRKRDEKEIFDVKPRHVEYWKAHNYDVMLVIRTSDGEIRWMNVTEHLKKQETETRQIIFDGEQFSARNVFKMRDKLLAENN